MRIMLHNPSRSFCSGSDEVCVSGSDEVCVTESITELVARDEACLTEFTTGLVLEA